MAEEFYIKGLEQFKRVAEVFRAEAGVGAGITGGVRKNLLAELRRAGAPVGAAIKGAYREKMPHAGGLNERLAAAKVGTRNRLTGASAGVTVVTAVPGYDLEAIEKGDLRHPVFGHGPWVSQNVPADVAGHAFAAMAPELEVRVNAAVEKVIAEIEAAT